MAIFLLKLSSVLASSNKDSKERAFKCSGYCSIASVSSTKGLIIPSKMNVEGKKSNESSGNYSFRKLSQKKVAPAWSILQTGDTLKSLAFGASLPKSPRTSKIIQA